MRIVPPAQSMSSSFSAKAQIDHAAHDRVAAQARGKIGREGTEQPLDFGRTQGLRKWRQPPARGRRDDGHQPLDALAFEGAEAQVAAHGRGRHAGAGRADARQLLAQELPKFIRRRQVGVDCH
jgi:hypothetical protein